MKEFVLDLFQKNGFQSFEIPSDYDPVSFDYTLDMPACFGQPALFTANAVNGGGCTDNDQYTIFVDNNMIEVGDQLYLQDASNQGINIIVVCDNPDDISCSQDWEEQIEIFSNYEVTSAIFQVSCPGQNDGNISVNIVDIETGLDLTNAEFEWTFQDPNTGFYEDLGTTSGESIEPNEWGITGQGGELSNLIGSVIGVNYEVLITDENGCALNNNEAFTFTIYEQQPLEIDTDKIIHDYKNCGYDVTCNGDDDSQITLDLPQIIEGGTFYNFVFNEETDSTSTVNLPNNNDLENYFFELYNGSNVDIENSSPIWGPVFANNFGENIVISTPLGAGEYTLALFSPSGVDSDNDGVGDGDYCFTTTVIEITEPEAIELNYTVNDDDNECYGDQNGYVTIDNISGGCPGELCEDDNTSFVQSFGGCVGAVAILGCDFVSFDGTPISEFCPVTCNNCPDLIFGYEVVIEDESGNTISNISNLAAGTYSIYVLDSSNCPSETTFFTITEPSPIELTEDIDGDGIINAENIVSKSEYNCFDENSNPYNISCFGENDGSISINVSSMNQLEGGPFTYQLYNNTGNLQSSASDSNAIGGIIVFDNLTAQDYTLEIWNANYLQSQDEDCKTTTVISLTEPNELIINEISAIEKECGYNVSCFGATDGIINVDVEGGCGSYTYSWNLIQEDENGNIISSTGINNPLGVNSSTIENVGAGQYLVTIFDGYCSESVDIILTEPEELLVTGSQTNVSCFGGSDGSLTVNISGGCPNDILGEIENYSIEWFNENGEQLEINYSTTVLSNTVTLTTDGLAEGYYEIHVTDANGCVNDGTNFTISEPDQALFVTETITDFNGFGISCNGANDGSIALELNGGTPIYF